MWVRNVIEECFDGVVRARHRTTSSVFHRISFAADDGGNRWWPYVEPIPDKYLDGVKVAARFRDVRQSHDWRNRPGVATGGQMPYHGVITVDGVIDQCLRFEDLGAHALKFNAQSMGWAVVGDFRSHAPTNEQWAACVWLAARLMALGHKIYGHTELPGSSSDADKVCPGKLFEMSRLRREAALYAVQMDAHTATKELCASGVVM